MVTIHFITFSVIHAYALLKWPRVFVFQHMTQQSNVKHSL